MLRLLRTEVTNAYSPLCNRMRSCEDSVVSLQLYITRCYSKHLSSSEHGTAAAGSFRHKRTQHLCSRPMRLQYEEARYQNITVLPRRLLLVRTYATYRSRHSKRDLYSVLNISPRATQSQIKDAYYKMSMKYHPDRNKGSEEAHERFTQITEAYSVLGQYEKRKKYDKGLLRDYAPPPSVHHHHQQPSSSFSMRKSKEVVYNFDEFYRAHYGDALRREQANRALKKRIYRQYEEEEHDETGDFNAHVLKVLMMVSLLITGWYFYGKSRKRNHH